MQKKLLISLILASLALGLFYNLGAIDLRAEEPRRAVVSMEMIFLDNYLVPHLNGWDYYNKPPLFNWVMVGFMKLFGLYEEWVVRLPSLLSYILIGVFSYLSFKKYVAKDVALLASLFFIISADLLFYGTVNTGEIDLFFSLLVFLQIMALFVFYQKKQWLLLFLVSYFFAALGTLTKGPPSVAFQGLTLIGMAIIYKDWRLLFRWQHFVAGFMFLAIVSGYFYWYSFYADAPSMVIRLFKEATMRTGLESKAWQIVADSLAFPFKMIQLMLPGALLVFFMFKKGFFAKLKSNPLVHFSLMFVLINIPIYWFTGDFKNRYVYMFFPFILLVVAYFFVENKNHMPRLARFFDWLFGVFIGIFALAFLALPFVEITASVKGVYFIAGAFAFALAATLWLYVKTPQLRIYTIILAFAVLRFGFDFVYQPLVNADLESTQYKKEMAAVLEAAEGNSILFYGQKSVAVSDASVGPLKLDEITLITPEAIPYEIPYYYGKARNELFMFTEELVPGNYYLGKAHWLDDGKREILYRFTTPHYGEYVLIKEF